MHSFNAFARFLAGSRVFSDFSPLSKISDYPFSQNFTLPRRRASSVIQPQTTDYFFNVEYFFPRLFHVARLFSFRYDIVFRFVQFCLFVC